MITIDKKRADANKKRFTLKKKFFIFKKTESCHASSCGR